MAGSRSPDAAELLSDTSRLARLEGLEAHARAAAARRYRGPFDRPISWIMWLDIVALGILTLFAVMGAARGGLTRGLALASLGVAGAQAQRGLVSGAGRRIPTRAEAGVAQQHPDAH